MRKFAREITVWFALAALLLPYLAFAANSKPIPLDLKVEILSQNKVESLAQYIGLVYQYVTGVASILAVAMIMWGGMKWIFAGDDSGKIGKARDTIINAIMGLVLALGSFVLLNTVNPALVDLKMPALTSINPESMLKGGPCPTTGDLSIINPPGPYQCGKSYNLTGSSLQGESLSCIGMNCGNFGECSQWMSSNPSDLTKFQCIQPESCRNGCAQVDSEVLCTAQTCWNKFKTTCFWESGACKNGRPANESCEKDEQCASRICNLGYGIGLDASATGFVRSEDRCTPKGGDLEGKPCDRDLDCGCFNFNMAGDPQVCQRVCDFSEGIDQCVKAFSKPSGEQCSHNNQCTSGRCTGLKTATSYGLGGALIGAAIGATSACLSWGAAVAAGGVIFAGVGAIPGAAIGCLGGALFGGGVGGAAGAVVGGVTVGTAAVYLSDGNCD